MNKLYAIYKHTSDPNDLPDYTLYLCADCADNFPSTRIAIALDDSPTDNSCYSCC